MSYANKKGATGEREAAEFFNEVFKEWGHQFMRIGGQEKNKKMLHGDIIVDRSTDKEEKNMFGKYFLEVKTRAAMNIWDVVQEAKDNASTYGKHGSIVYATKQGKGHKREGTIIAMTKDTFQRICRELQGYRSEDKSN